ncbi:MAG TPA: PQQ-dependent sugar dehydrogenase [Caulobacteraceae bacterium]|nr:PQQ-dependent sugar dehydrogenase [Caulobacteraceae bacterium]
MNLTCKRWALLGAAGLLSAPAVATAQAPAGVPPILKHTVEGQPVDSRPPEMAGDYPVFPGQTRAPYHKTTAVKVTVLASGLDWPWSVAPLPGGRFLITEKPGGFVILDKDGAPQHTITANVPRLYAIGQSGLLDVVLDPAFTRNHRIFFTYMAVVDADNTAISVARATLDADKGELTDVRTIFQTAPYTIKVVTNAGSRIAIDPKDGTLFVTVGDRDRGVPVPMQAQQLDTYLGKVIHISADGQPAPDNPGLGLPDTWSLGHRSPEGLAFAPDGRLWEIEHGPRGGDELNLIQKGKNYGWPVITHGIDYSGAKIGEGIVEKPGLEQPRYYWDPVFAPSGMAFYKGALFPQWRRSVLIGGLRSQVLIRLELGKDDKVVNEEALLTEVDKRIRDVRVFPDGAVYVLTDGAQGQLLKLTPN